MVHHSRPCQALLAAVVLLLAGTAMSEPYVGEVRLWPATFAPVGWEFCDGRLLPIAEYEVLYFIIGTTYGGNGVTTFAVPDLRGRAPIHQGSNGQISTVVGESSGTETVTLLSTNLPSHTHAHTTSATVSVPISGHTHTFKAANQTHTHFYVVPGLYDRSPNATAATNAAACSVGTDATFKSNLAKCQVTLPIAITGQAATVSTGPQTIAPSGTTDSAASAVTSTIDTAALSNDVAGGSQPHENRAPYLGINYIIAYQGIFPSQN